MKFLLSLLLVSGLFACTFTHQPAPGLYYGYLPCADCPGISYSLDLESDGTYRLQRFYSGRSEAPTESNGTYTVSGNRLTLTGGELSELSMADSRLIVLDKSGRPISGDLADRYELRREKPNEWNMIPEKTTTAEMVSGTWRVLSLNGQEVEASTDNTPTINFDLDAKRMSGSTGCNQYSSNFTIDEKAGTLVPGEVVSTRIACMGDNPEAEFLRVLNVGTLSYRVEAERLYLQSGEGRMELGR